MSGSEFKSDQVSGKHQKMTAGISQYSRRKRTNGKSGLLNYLNKIYYSIKHAGPPENKSDNVVSVNLNLLLDVKVRFLTLLCGI